MVGHGTPLNAESKIRCKFLSQVASVMAGHLTLDSLKNQQLGDQHSALTSGQHCNHNTSRVVSHLLTF